MHTESEIENPVGLSRHYEEKVKVYIYLKKKKRMKGVSILSIPHSLFLPLPPTFGKFHVVIC